MANTFKLFLCFSLVFVVVYSQGGMNLEALGGQGKKFFADMTKKAMGVPSLKPENLAAQSFFRSFLDKYTKLDDKIKNDMMKHVPTVTKIFNQAAAKYNVKPMEAFQMLSTFFTNFKQSAGSGMAQQGLKMAGNFLKNRNNQQQVAN